jgi:hypothetical protein
MALVAGLERRSSKEAGRTGEFSFNDERLGIDLDELPDGKDVEQE